MTLPIGTPAPNFTLKTKTPEGLSDVDLNSHQGGLLGCVAFFPICIHWSMYGRNMFSTG